MPPVFGFRTLRVVTCQLPDVPPPWELERDARGLTFDVLSGCVGLTELVEGIPVLKSHQRLTCLTRPSARDLSALARLRGHRKQPGVQTNQGKRPAALARFGVYQIHCSVNQEGNPAPSVSSRALWPLTTLGLVWPSGLWPCWVLSGLFGH